MRKIQFKPHTFKPHKDLQKCIETTVREHSEKVIKKHAQSQKPIGRSFLDESRGSFLIEIRKGR